tara:strand:- start:22838 stop:23227 length:390 start_codon:yes stop_codon:yes gene_type:complete
MNKLTKEQYDALPDYEQRLVDKGLPTIAETKNYKQTTKWVPYNEYMERIYLHHPGREFDEFNMEQDWCDKQIEPDRLLREAAYLIAIKERPCSRHDSIWTEEEQLYLEETLYNKFRSFAAEWYIINDLD